MTRKARTRQTTRENTLGVDLLNRASLFALNMKSWGGAAKADLSKIDTNADKEWLRMRKTLLESEEFHRIKQHQAMTRQWCVNRSMPSFLRVGIYFVALTEVERYEQYLAAAVRELRTDLVPRFIEVYPGQREAAKASLKKLFNIDDYPTTEDMGTRFDIEWNWIYFGLPDNLPSIVREREAEKLKKAYADAQVQIVAALRTGFAELVSHAVEKLKVEPGKKPPVFKETLVTNIAEFCETFSARNIMQDEELSALVTRARDIVRDVKADDLRQYENEREKIAAAFADIKGTMDTMVVTPKGRKFHFDE